MKSVLITGAYGGMGRATAFVYNLNRNPLLLLLNALPKSLQLWTIKQILKSKDGKK